MMGTVGFIVCFVPFDEEPDSADCFLLLLVFLSSCEDAMLRSKKDIARVENHSAIVNFILRCFMYGHVENSRQMNTAENHI